METASGITSALAPPLLPDPGSRANWTRLYGASKSVALANAAARDRRLFVYIAGDAANAAQADEELAFFAPELPRYHLPDWETLPYDRFSPYQDIVSERIATLTRLPTLKHGVVVLSASTAMHRLPPRQWLSGRAFDIVSGQRIDRDEFRRQLDTAGYRAATQVGEHGEFAFRGSLIDLFPMGSTVPYRLDLFDDEVETIRIFDAESQRSQEVVEAMQILPACEYPFDDSSRRDFCHAWRLKFDDESHRSPIYVDVREGLAPAGIEYYLPLFFDSLSSLADYLPNDVVVVFDESVEASVDKFSESVNERYESLRYDLERPLVPPNEMFLLPGEFGSSFDSFSRLTLSGTSTETDALTEFACRAPVKVPVDPRANEPFAVLERHIAEVNGRVLLLADSLGRRETLADLFRGCSFRPVVVDSWQSFLAGDDPVNLAVASLNEGFEATEPGISVLSEAQLFGQRAQQKRRRRRSSDSEAVIRNLTELNVGAPVVHERYGVGRYRGLEVLTAGGITNEFIKVEYADGDNLYVPVGALDLISRYAGVDPDHAPLHKLGSGQWDKARRKAAEKIRDVAAELLEIHAQREARSGFQFSIETDAYNVFVQDFPFEETPDQANAVDAVLADMQQARPMDRLICGDVGFGKTEVAMRAAFVAVNAGKQVAILVPTTLLARQHFQTLCDRFADWPVRVEQLSRFADNKATQSTLNGLASGQVDVVVGTHKLLSKDIKFHDLGLLIVDEEHRFGVSQKEKIKALRADVDILTLTATPIPRTLNMALSGTRDLSIIATAPQKRLAIKTFVREWSNELLREAILREIARGGQVYFVHNKVEDIEAIAESVREIVPEARIDVAQGQMRERDLERIMLDFYHGRCNVLVCTTIIETGIDVPNANTMIINRADKFGLAQLYQLRGRVGRSHHRAYAYLVVPHRKSMTADAIKRLEAIESLEELGVGFTLATHDLEIRGAGEILGEEQSGHIQEIGFGLYTELLSRTVAALKDGRALDADAALENRIEVELHIPALLPEDYLPDVHARLLLYKRIAGAETPGQLDDLKEEIIDRFGLFGEPVENLFRVTLIKLMASEFGIKRIDLGRRGGRIEFVPNPDIDPMCVIDLIQSDSAYRMEGNEKLKVSKPLEDAESRYSEIEFLFDRFRRRYAA